MTLVALNATTFFERGVGGYSNVQLLSSYVAKLYIEFQGSVYDVNIVHAEQQSITTTIYRFYMQNSSQ